MAVLCPPNLKMVGNNLILLHLFYHTVRLPDISRLFEYLLLNYLFALDEYMTSNPLLQTADRCSVSRYYARVSAMSAGMDPCSMRSSGDIKARHSLSNPPRAYLLG